MPRYLYRAHVTGTSAPVGAPQDPRDKVQELLDLVAAEADADEWELFSVTALDGELVGFARKAAEAAMPFGAS